MDWMTQPVKPPQFFWLSLVVAVALAVGAYYLGAYNANEACAHEIVGLRAQYQQAVRSVMTDARVVHMLGMGSDKDPGKQIISFDVEGIPLGDIEVDYAHHTIRCLP